MRFLFQKFAIMLILLSLGACATNVEERGVTLDPDKIKQIEIGKSSLTDVASILGSPGATSTFGDLTWYYIAQKTETWAFRKPKIKKQDVVIVHFDKGGIVQSIEQKDLSDAQFVGSVDKSTPSAESQLTILQQMLGNIGRFSGREGATPSK